MAKVIVSEFVSLDGIAEAPERWSLKYWNDELAALKLTELQSADALLLGRNTYEVFAASWPTRSGDAYSDRINSLPKYVASSTTTDFAWSNSHHMSSDIATEVKRLKSERVGDIVVFGSLSFAEDLRRAGLVDAYRLLVYPVLLGGGKRLFPEGGEGALRLMDARSYGEAVLLNYEA